jgi:hypothetical protein
MRIYCKRLIIRYLAAASSAATACSPPCCCRSASSSVIRRRRCPPACPPAISSFRSSGSILGNGGGGVVGSVHSRALMAGGQPNNAPAAPCCQSRGRPAPRPRRWRPPCQTLEGGGPNVCVFVNVWLDGVKTASSDAADAAGRAGCRRGRWLRAAGASSAALIVDSGPFQAYLGLSWSLQSPKSWWLPLPWLDRASWRALGVVKDAEEPLEPDKIGERPPGLLNFRES